MGENPHAERLRKLSKANRPESGRSTECMAAAWVHTFCFPSCHHTAVYRYVPKGPWPQEWHSWAWAMAWHCVGVLTMLLCVRSYVSNFGNLMKEVAEGYTEILKDLATESTQAPNSSRISTEDP